MKQKLTYILMIYIGLTLFSCRGADDEIPVKQNTSETNKNLLKTSMKIYDSLKVEMQADPTNPPKDPPKTGNHWKFEN
ncbi:hypothetical protein [Elizabethkingia sp. JS20170427COW]|uniref:hypothetical protein n=1 Tax=Elizabethkingia sp. JS20170427COW TaxID=2583851 RepID=UPI00110FF93D|nr:hypothetical protein [Elizabethkingia sp. JS20170427COW]QCX54368.1 hypothetical protein FGE20_11770 [Elizabethkingia sp. JS20170427COW]